MVASLPKVLLIAAFALATPFVNVQAQDPPGGERLLGLAGDHSIVRYTPGYLDRAEHVLARVDLVVGALENLGKLPLSISALVLPRESWEELATLLRPYGTPAIVGGSVIAVPAMGDRETVRLWKGWMGSDLPALSGRPLRGTSEGVSSLALADLLLQRDIAAIFVDRVGLGGEEPWIRGLMTHMAALSLFTRYEPSRLLSIETMYRRLEEHLPIVIELMEDRPTVVERWLLQEAQYFRGAQRVYTANGDKALKSAIKSVAKEGPLNRAKMLELFPEVEEWLTLEAEAASSAGAALEEENTAPVR